MKSPIYPAVVAVLAIGNFSARGAMISPCTNPIVLPETRVQVFLVPYQAEGKLTERGRELATIVQRHVLFAALKYQSIAVEELTGDSRHCETEDAINRIVPRLKVGQTAIFLRGRLFERADALQLQSTLVVMTAGQTDTLTWELTGLNAKVSATLPGEPVLFAPRAIPLNLLEVLQDAQREARRLHQTPTIESPYKDLPGDSEARYGFEVLGAENDWMHVRVFPLEEEGWVPAHALTTGDGLKGAFPELYFVDGLIGYNELKNSSTDSRAPQTQRTLKAMQDSLNKYLELSSTSAESEARALAAVLRTNAQWRLERDSKPYLVAVGNAQKGYLAAEQIAPATTLADNFQLACALALCAAGECPVNPNQLHSQFLAAIARDPTDKELLQNMALLYDSVSRGSVSLALSPKEIMDRRNIVDEAAKNLP